MWPAPSKDSYLRIAKLAAGVAPLLNSVFMRADHPRPCITAWLRISMTTPTRCWPKHLREARHHWKAEMIAADCIAGCCDA